MDGAPPIAKSVLCAHAGASLLIDDNNTYALQCAEAGVSVLHFNEQGRYPWGRGLQQHRLITPCESWADIERAVEAHHLSVVSASMPLETAL